MVRTIFKVIGGLFLILITVFLFMKTYNRENSELQRRYSDEVNRYCTAQSKTVKGLADLRDAGVRKESAIYSISGNTGYTQEENELVKDAINFVYVKSNTSPDRIEELYFERCINQRHLPI